MFDDYAPSIFVHDRMINQRASYLPAHLRSSWVHHLTDYSSMSALKLDGDDGSLLWTWQVCLHSLRCTALAATELHYFISYDRPRPLIRTLLSVATTLHSLHTVNPSYMKPRHWETKRITLLERSTRSSTTDVATNTLRREELRDVSAKQITRSRIARG